MSPDDREALLKWHADNYQTEFNFNEIMAEYCISDVTILTHGMLKLQEEFMELSKKKVSSKSKDDVEEGEIDDEEEDEIALDILERCRTVASSAMDLFR